MNITMPRGDIRPVSFKVNGGQDSIVFDNIYFTVKKSHKEKDFLFQKTLASGTIELMDDGTYQFTIEPEDTNTMDYGQYVFDIEILSENAHIKQTFLGTLVLTQEVTFAANEV